MTFLAVIVALLANLFALSPQSGHRRIDDGLAGTTLSQGPSLTTCTGTSCR